MIVNTSPGVWRLVLLGTGFAIGRFICDVINAVSP